jgi:DNA-binding winged helix-turn-helix (wHTH) protein/TolB-like protein
MQSNRLYAFGQFKLDSLRRLLWRDNELVQLKPKAFDMLLLLVENGGRVIEKDEMMQRLWPDTIVEENSLSKNISALRRLLGEDAREHRYIVTAPGRGYSFVAPVREIAGAEEGLGVRKETGASQTARLETGATQGPMAAAEDSIPGQSSGHSSAQLYRQEATQSSGQSREPSPPKPRSIAVLPFQIIGGDQTDAYMGVGLADALITRLSSLGNVVVRPTSSIVRYAQASRDLAAIGLDLSVDCVLEANVRRAGGSIRVTAQLVGEGRALWAGKFDEEFTNIFDVEDRVSELIASALALELTGEERSLLTHRYTDSTEAYQLYWKGRHQLSQDETSLALECFQQAVELDPNFVLAYVGIADVYNNYGFLELLPPTEAFPRAKAAVEKALALDDHLAEAHTELATIKILFEWDIQGAEAELKRALQFNPHLAKAHQVYGWLLALQGREESFAEIEQALALDPLSRVIPALKGEDLYYLGRYEEAITCLESAIASDPSSLLARTALGLCYEQTGEGAKAIALYQEAGLATGLPLFASQLACAYASVGRREEAAALLTELKDRARQFHVSPLLIAQVHAALGEKEEAFVWLEIAYQKRDPKLVYLKMGPRWEPLRDDPRFQNMLACVNPSGSGA